MIKRLITFEDSSMELLRVIWPLASRDFWAQSPAVLVSLTFHVMGVSGSRLDTKHSSLKSLNSRLANSTLCFGKWVKYFTASG